MEKEDARVLNKLGLSALQVKIYLTLAESGTTSANAISSLSGIDRSDTYKIILKLQNQGLVEKTISFPNQYDAVPMRAAIEILLRNRKERELEIENEAYVLLQKLSLCRKKKNHESDAKFIMIPEKGALIKKSRDLLESARSEAIVVTNAKRYPQVMQHFASDFSQIINRKAKVRILTEKNRYEKSTPMIKEGFWANPNFEIRCMLTSPATTFSLYDREMAMIAIDPRQNFLDSKVIWTNHTGIVTALGNLFESMWNQAQVLGT